VGVADAFDQSTHREVTDDAREHRRVDSFLGGELGEPDRPQAIDGVEQ
jgi:hypothetical protein